MPVGVEKTFILLSIFFFSSDLLTRSVAIWSELLYVYEPSMQGISVIISIYRYVLYSTYKYHTCKYHSVAIHRCTG